MGVYIPNMSKPKKCVGCPIDERWCKLWKDFDSWDVETHPDCPLIDIVQCNDCKYGHKHILKDTYDCDKSDITVFHEADFFCKASERRE